MSACNLRVIEIGSSFPCLAPEDFQSNFTEFTDSFYRDEVYIIMGPVSNVGKAL